MAIQVNHPAGKFALLNQFKHDIQLQTAVGDNQGIYVFILIAGTGPDRSRWSLPGSTFSNKKLPRASLWARYQVRI